MLPQPEPPTQPPQADRLGSEEGRGPRAGLGQGAGAGGRGQGQVQSTAAVAYPAQKSSQLAQE